MILWPNVKAGLLQVFAGLGGGALTVFDGPPVTRDAPSQYVTVGYVLGQDNGGTFTTLRGPGDLNTETGSVLTELVCATGATDLPGMQTAAFAYVQALQSALYGDRTLAGALPHGVDLRLTVDILPAQTQSGAVQRLLLTVEYESAGLLT